MHHMEQTHRKFPLLKQPNKLESIQPLDGKCHMRFNPLNGESSGEGGVLDGLSSAIWKVDDAKVVKPCMPILQEREPDSSGGRRIACSCMRDWDPAHLLAGQLAHSNPGMCGAILLDSH